MLFQAAPAPDFFKRLRLQGAKNTWLRLPSPDVHLLTNILILVQLYTHVSPPIYIDIMYIH